jgi:transcriptional regulator with XRE-family HTH domain
LWEGNVLANKESLLLTQAQEQYVAWLILPEDQRQPPLKKDFAELIGVTTSTLVNWEKKKPFIERWRLGVEGLNQSPERTQRLLEALYVKGVAGDVKSAELYLKATGNMPNQTMTIKNETTVKEMTDDELEKMILELNEKQKNNVVPFKQAQ